MGEIGQGDLVSLSSFSSVFKLFSLHKNLATLTSLDSSITLLVHISKLTKVDSQKLRNNKLSVAFCYNKFCIKNYPSEIDLHGLNSQEAVIHLEAFIERAIIAQNNRLLIIHGKGSGTLKKTAIDFIKNKFVKQLPTPSHLCKESVLYVEILE